MSATRDNNFTPKQIRGVDLAVKSLSKIYPFIKGWRFDSQYEKWITSLYIDLFVDWKEYGKFYNLEFDEFYLKRYDSIADKLISSAPSAFFNPFERSTEGYDQFLDQSYERMKELKVKLLGLYEMLPEEFIVNYEMESALTGKFYTPVSIVVDDFVDYRLM